jgi:hypothetical protein
MRFACDSCCVVEGYLVDLRFGKFLLDSPKTCRFVMAQTGLVSGYGFLDSDGSFASE